MATQYLRITKLHDVRGRIDYISNPERQENLLAYRTTMDSKMRRIRGTGNTDSQRHRYADRPDRRMAVHPARIRHAHRAPIRCHRRTRTR